MKKIIFTLVAFVILSSLQAQHLWKISGNRLKKPSYIFATHPYVSSTFLDNKSDVFKYFKQTNKILGEFNSQDFEGLKVIQQNAFLSGKRTLQMYMNEDDFKFANAFLMQHAGFTLESVSLLKPQFVLALYYEQLARTLPENKEGLFLDAWFQWYAGEKGKVVGGLESIEEYLTYSIDTISIEKQTQKMLGIMKGNDAFKTNFRTQINEYKTGKMEDLYQDDNVNFLNNTVSAQRNLQRANVIENEIYNTTCFITINTASLQGENGLLKILESKGFKVSALELKK